MDLDIPIFSKTFDNNTKLPYNVMLTKILRKYNDDILSSYVKYNGSSITINLTLKNIKELYDELQEIKFNCL